MNACFKAKADLRALAGALDAYAADHSGIYPQALDALLRPDDDGYRYLGLESLPRDPWGHAYLYEPPAGARTYRVRSLGEDGEPGGEGYDRDLDSASLVAEAWIGRIAQEVDDYAALHGGEFPSSLAPLLRPYYLDCDSVPLDPWGRPYAYRPPEPGSTAFHVFTLGADGRAGGEAEDKDIGQRFVREAALSQVQGYPCAFDLFD